MEALTKIPLFGSMVGCSLVALGGIAGLLLKKRLPEKLTDLTLQGMALFVLALGISMSVPMNHPLAVIASTAAGCVAGGIIDLEGRIDRLADRIERSLGDRGGGFAKGFVTASVLYCTGSMAVLGSLQEGLGEFPDILIAKGMIDGVVSVPLAAGLGFGVVCSTAVIFTYQGAMTLAAGWIEPLMTETAVRVMTETGGLMLAGLAFNLLNLTKIRVMNMLPGLLFAVIIAKLFLA